MPNSRHIINPSKWGWHPFACVAIGVHNIGNALYAMDPTANSYRALINIGAAVPPVLFMQVTASTVIILQGLFQSWRSSRHAYVWWMILSACALARLAGAAASRNDADFQQVLYLFGVALIGWGAWNASRTR